MISKTFALASGFALALAGASPGAVTGHSGLKGDAAIPARQSAMALSGAAMAAMKGAIDRGADVRQQQFAAQAIAKWSRALPGLFPRGSEGPTSHALPAVWKDRAGFEAAAASYAAAADAMVAAAKSGDRDAFSSAWTATRARCQACHDAYKKPEA